MLTSNALDHWLLYQLCKLCSSSAVSGLFQAHSNGSIHKNGLAVLDEDVVIILHDNIASSLSEHVNGTSSLYELIALETTRMRADMLVLGWQEIDAHDCNLSDTRSQAIFSRHVFVYALSRVGARKTVQLFDPCGPTALEQIWHWVCSALFTVAYADRNLFVLPSLRLI